ncbi:MAG: hypothetical protein A3K03_06300 [Bdellovibrionales bacterium RIFOXYD1_FULL_44_7]|nr:MAG: hypothetical protein A3K03_06300 [Bdellovibrionales bacterium RIFOXYD1_FULL_44_7]
MKLLNILFFVSIVFGVSGCATMYFHNGDAKKDVAYMNEWHHDGVFRLVEFSPPVDLAQRCEKETWKTIKIEQTFVQGLVQAISYNLYDPWDVNYYCSAQEAVKVAPKARTKKK